MITHNRINYILLGTLWLLAIVLVLDFWLNTAYNFNMFSQTHWQYVANLQAAHKPIKSGFYIAITLAVSCSIFGFFMLFRPRFRKILLQIPDNTKVVKKETPVSQPAPAQPVIKEQKTVSAPAQTPAPMPKPASAPTMQRPPQLHIQTPQTPLRAPTPRDETPKKVAAPVAKYVTEIQDIFTQAGYKTLTPKKIKGVPLSLVAIGSNETLWLGACDISHEQMADIILAFKAIFDETLEDIDIDINTFIINPSDQESVDGILTVKDLDELKKTMTDMPNEPESDADKESGSMDAFGGYIETVLTYLGNS